MAISVAESAAHKGKWKVSAAIPIAESTQIVTILFMQKSVMLVCACGGEQHFIDLPETSLCIILDVVLLTDMG